MKTTSNSGQPTFESVWAALQETDRIIKDNAEKAEKRSVEIDRIIKDNAEKAEKRLVETDRIIKDNAEKAEKRSVEIDRQFQETSAEIKKVNQTLGAWASNQGRFAEEYFINSFEQGKTNFFGEQFDEIEKNVKGIEKHFKDEYDLLLLNGSSIGIIEIKFKAHENDIPSILRKAETFRYNFPKYKNFRIYLGLASLSFYEDLEKACIEQGIAVIKQVGGLVVINDTNLKVF